MNREQILSAIRDLSFSQGFYGRLYHKLIDGSNESEDYIANLVEQGFADVVDMVMYIEE